ncbi:MAG: hypothetical protein IJ019_04650 [Alphaproteobacteria bacterium]|nr:hypothetical protein [Alphaproteobacteria bacterium]
MSLIEKIKTARLELADGFKSDDIVRYQQKLKRANVAPIPLSYAKMLEKIGAIASEDAFLYGIVNDNNMLFYDIYKRNTEHTGIKQSNLLLLGDNRGEYLCYSWQDKAYIILSKENFTVIKKIKILEEVVIYFLRDYI